MAPVSAPCKTPLPLLLAMCYAVLVFRVILSIRNQMSASSRLIDVDREDAQLFNTSVHDLLKRSDSVMAPLPGGKIYNPKRHKTLEETKVDLENIHKKRREHLEFVCSSSESDNLSNRKADKHLRFVPSLNLMYCPSTEQNTPSRPLEVHGGKNIFNIQNILNYAYKERENKTTLTPPLKVIYTHNPWWKLFEFYVNNFVSPKQRYFEFGKNIISKYKETAKNTTECDFNVTFADFTRYVRETPFKHDVAGVTNKCDVCSEKYDVIGKDDTVEQDTLFLQKILKSDTGLSYREFKHNYAVNEIKAFVISAFEERELLPCFTNHTIFRRLWRQLQIWGYIDTDNSYPYTSEESNQLMFDSLFSTVLKRFEQISVSKSKSNREEAFMLAYKPISLNEIERLRNIYIDDFFLFDYSDRPAVIFFKQGPNIQFPYFDVIELV